MTFNHFQLNGNYWESIADAIEQRLRLARADSVTGPDPEFPEAEIDDAQRRAAMARERIRRQGRS